MLAILATGSAAAHAEDGPLVAVWVQTGHGLPVEGARVKIVDARGRSLLRAARVTTPASGAVVVPLRRHTGRFRVIANGGRVRGEPLNARLESAVRIRRDERVVYVNPATSLVARYARRAGVDTGIATRRIKRFLGIPRSASIGRDVRRGELHFSGDEFHRRANRRGGVHRYLEELAQQAHADPLARHTVRASEDGLLSVTAAAGDSVESAASTDGLALDLLDNLADDAESEGLGWLLSLGSGDASAAALAEIKQQLQQIAAELVEIEAGVEELERQLAQTTYDVLAAGAETYVAFASEVEDRLSHLAELPVGGDPGRQAAVDALIEYIQANQDAAKQLDLRLRGGAPGADGILVAASRAVAAEDRFFTSTDSSRVRAVYDFYATVQAVIAMAITEYQHARGIPALLIQDALHDIRTNLEQQESGFVKPVLPLDGTSLQPSPLTLDTATGLMWRQGFSLPWLEQRPVYVTGGVPPVDAFGGTYELATIAQLQGLVKGLPRTNPAAALGQLTGILSPGASTKLYTLDNPPPPGCEMNVSDGPPISILAPCGDVARAGTNVIDCWWASFDLATGTVIWDINQANLGNFGFFGRCTQDPRAATFVGTLAFVRAVQPNESYFFE